MVLHSRDSDGRRTEMTQMLHAPGTEHRDKVKILPIDWIQLGLFSAYAFSYSLYMSQVLSSSVYYACLAIFVVFAAARVSQLFLRTRPGNPLIFGRSAVALVLASVALVLISVVQELAATGEFSYTSFTAASYILVPTLIALCIANTSTERVADIYMTLFLARYLLYFAISGEFSIEAILSISWSDSASPFETSYAHDLLVVGMYFVVRQKKIRAGISTVFTMLALKRAAFFAAPLFLIFGRWLRVPTPPRIRTVLVLFLLGAASPFIVMATYSLTFTQLFSEKFGRGFDEFTSGRLSIYRLSVHCADTSHAFGSLNSCLSELALRLNGTTWNSLLHNDTLRVYIEVGILGVVAYMGALAYVSRLSRPAYILVAYTFFVLTTSRLITHMSFWIVLFTAIALFEMLQSNREKDITNPDDSSEKYLQQRSKDGGSNER